MLPLSERDLAEYAYYFDEAGQGELVGDLSRRALRDRPGVAALRDALDAWAEASERGATLVGRVEAGAWRITDTRTSGDARESVADGLLATVLDATADAPKRERVLGELVENGASVAEAEAALTEALERGWVLALDGRIVRVVLVDPVIEQPPQIRFPGGVVLRPEFVFGAA